MKTPVRVRDRLRIPCILPVGAHFYGLEATISEGWPRRLPCTVWFRESVRIPCGQHHRWGVLEATMNARGIEALGSPAEGTTQRAGSWRAPQQLAHSNDLTPRVSGYVGLASPCYGLSLSPSKSAPLWVSLVMFPLTPFRSGQYTPTAVGRPDPRRGGPCRPFALGSTRAMEGRAWNEIWPWMWSG